MKQNVLFNLDKKGRGVEWLTSFLQSSRVPDKLLAYKGRDTLRGVQDIFTHINISTERNY